MLKSVSYGYIKMLKSNAMEYYIKLILCKKHMV